MTEIEKKAKEYATANEDDAYNVDRRYFSYLAGHKQALEEAARLCEREAAMLGMVMTYDETNTIPQIVINAYRSIAIRIRELKGESK